MPAARFPTPPTLPPPGSLPPASCLFRDWAVYYLRLGISVIPICHPHHDGFHYSAHLRNCTRPGKSPAEVWKRYMDERAGLDQVEEWGKRNGGYNLGAAMGVASGLIGWDVDGVEAESLIHRLYGGEIPVTWEFATPSGGRRLLLRLPPGLSVKTTTWKTGDGELRLQSRDAQTVMPPSLGKNGQRYEWVPGRSPCEIEPAVAGTREASLCQEKRRTISVPGGGGVRPAPAGQELDELERRARGWLRTRPGAVSGSGGHNATFHVACWLVHTFRLPDSVALLLLVSEYNPRCQPRWTEAELAHKVADARQRGNGPELAERPATAPASTRSAPEIASSLPPAPSANGTAPTSRPAPASTRSGASADAGGRGPDAPEEDAPHGVLLSDLVELSIEWFFHPYVPRGMVTAVVGVPGIGKTTLEAFLAKTARRSIILPGEEDIPRLLLPRLKANGVKLDTVRAIKPGEGWQFPRSRDRLVSAIQQHGADLVVLDPVDDYLVDGFNDNDAGHVRRLLQALREVAELTGVAIVICRHPGKDRANVMVGSRAWGAVPRSIIELMLDPGPPERRIIRPYKDSLGQNAPARYFDLVGPAGKPKVFTLGDLVAPDVIALAKEEPDRIDRWKVDQAEALIRALLAKGEMESRQVYAAGEGERLKDRTMLKAANRLGVRFRREGSRDEARCLWSLPPAGATQAQE